MPWHVVADHLDCGAGKFAVVANDSDELVSCHPNRQSADAAVTKLYAERDDAGGGRKTYAAAMSTADVNDLPDSAFAYIEPGGLKDASGKTTPRSLRHFPVHDAAHVRNALARIAQGAAFGDQALPKVRAAAKQFGVEVNAAAGQLTGVELARPGVWKLVTGKTEFTEAMLRDAADFFAASGGQAVPVSLGHFDDRFDGEPSFGSVTNIRFHADERGPVLLGDITGMPGWLAAAAPSRWPNRSVEGWRDFEYGGRTYSLVLSGLAFLGATPPGMLNIASLADLKTALAASGAQRVLASAPDDDPASPPVIPPATSSVASTRGTEAGQMDPAKIREALDLAADASDEDVKAALAAAGLTTVAPPAEPVPVAAAAAPGTVVLASSVWEETQNTIKRLNAFVDRQRRDERDTVIARAVQDGKFTPAQRQHFASLWDKDPDGTRTLIDALTKNSALAVAASGYAAEGDQLEEDEFDRELARLSDPTRSSRKAASRG